MAVEHNGTYSISHAVDPDQVNVSPLQTTVTRFSRTSKFFPNNSSGVHVLPPQASDISDHSQLVKSEGRNLHRRCVCCGGVDIRQQWHPCSYFCLSPALSCVTNRACRACSCLRSTGPESHERYSFRCISKLTYMYSLWHQCYLPAPGLGLLWHVASKDTKREQLVIAQQGVLM